MKSTHFNLVDLVDCRVGNDDHRVRTFSTKTELQGYSMDTGYLFPSKSENAGGLLKYILLDDVAAQVSATNSLPGPPYDNSISKSSLDRENLAYLWMRSYDS